MIGYGIITFTGLATIKRRIDEANTERWRAGPTPYQIAPKDPESNCDLLLFVSRLSIRLENVLRANHGLAVSTQPFNTNH